MIRMTRMTGPDCAGMCNLINTHTHTHIHYSSRLELVLLCGRTLVTGSLLKPLSTVYSIQYKLKCAPNLISGSRRTYKNVIPRIGSRTDCC